MSSVTYPASVSGSVDLTQDIAFSGDITPASLAVSQNDYSPTGLSTASTIRQASSANVDITGLAGGIDGRIIIFHNVNASGGFSITLKDESASSAAANRFALQMDIVLAPEGSIQLRYDGISSRWRPADSVGSLPTFTAGAIPFGSSGGTLTEDNPNLTFDDSTNRLSVGRGGAATVSTVNLGGNVHVSAGGIADTDSFTRLLTTGAATIQVADAATTGGVFPLTLRRRTSAVVATGYGVGCTIQSETTTDALVEMARFLGIWIDPTDGSESSAFQLDCRTAGVLTNAYQFRGTQALGVDGTAALPGWSFSNASGMGIAKVGTDLTESVGGVERRRMTSAGNGVHGTAALLTTATDGFPYVPSVPGTPTGVPTAFTGRVPYVFDSVANKLWAYIGGAWRDITGGGGGTSFPKFHLYADQLDSPNSANWIVNAMAPAAADSLNAALTVRRFDNTTEEGVGFMCRIPASAVNIIVGIVSRAQTAPGAARTVGVKVYFRQIPDAAAVSTTWAGANDGSHVLTDIDIPTTTDFQTDSQTLALTATTPDLVADRLYQMELTRINPTGGTELTGDWSLLELTIAFS